MPHGHVHDHERIVVEDNIRRVPGVRFQTPNKTWGTLGQRIDLFQLIDEIGDLRVINGSQKPPDINLRQVKTTAHNFSVNDEGRQTRRPKFMQRPFGYLPAEARLTSASRISPSNF